jgi:hypothetical protein
MSVDAAARLRSSCVMNPTPDLTAAILTMYTVHEHIDDSQRFTRGMLFAVVAAVTEFVVQVYVSTVTCAAHNLNITFAFRCHYHEPQDWRILALGTGTFTALEEFDQRIRRCSYCYFPGGDIESSQIATLHVLNHRRSR